MALLACAFRHALRVLNFSAFILNFLKADKMHYFIKVMKETIITLNKWIALDFLLLCFFKAKLHTEDYKVLIMHYYKWQWYVLWSWELQILPMGIW